MNGTPLFNESEVRKTLSVLIEPGAVFEIRALNAKLNGGYKAGTISGYFDSTEKCLEQLSSITSAEAVYVTLNPVHRDLLSRRANRLDFTGRDSTTGDQHIIKRRWLLIDCDAERVSGISASNLEKEFATAKAREVYAFLVKERGWTPPVACDSGNGNHLLFRVDLPAEDDGLVKRVLEGLAARFNGDGVKVDVSVFNPARITKLYGTLAAKGDSTQERPHRMSKVLAGGSNGAVVTRDQLEALANELAPPAPERPVLAESNRIFDVDGFIVKHGLKVARKHIGRDGLTKWHLEQCPLTGDHGQSYDPVISQTPEGVTGFKCFGERCTGKGWCELREHFEPAYREKAFKAERKPADKGQNEARQPTVAPRPLAELLDDVAGFLRRYVVFPLKEQSDVIAAWIVHTWTFKAFEFTPYLCVTSAAKRSGTTRVLEEIKHLAKNAIKTEGPTAAALIRKNDADNPHTMLIDEVDQIYDGKCKGDTEAKNMQRFLNAGFEKDANFLRCVGRGGTDIDVKEFPAFCPKALAGIGINQCLPDTVLDRSIPIEIERQSRDERAERLRKREVKAVAEPIRAELEAFAQQEGVIKALQNARPDLPDELNDRKQEICEPLLAIADMAGGDWPARLRAALVRLCGNEEDADLGVKMLAAIKKVYDDEGADKLFTRTILEKLVANADDAPWAYWFEDALKHDRLDSAASQLARRLKPYGIKPDKIRIGDETGKGYHRTQFKKAWELYLPAYSPPSQKGGTGFTRGTNHRNTREKECSPFSDARVNVHPLDEKGGTQKHEGKTPNVHPVHLVHPIRNKGKDGAFEAVAEQSGEQPAASNEGGGSGSVTATSEQAVSGVFRDFCDWRPGA